MGGLESEVVAVVCLRFRGGEGEGEVRAKGVVDARGGGCAGGGGCGRGVKGRRNDAERLWEWC